MTETFCSAIFITEFIWRGLGVKAPDGTFILLLLLQLFSSMFVVSFFSNSEPMLISSCYSMYIGLVLTPHTAACIMASRLPSGESKFPEINCSFTLFVNSFAFGVKPSTCLYPKAGWHSSSFTLHGFCSFFLLVLV